MLVTADGASVPVKGVALDGVNPRVNQRTGRLHIAEVTTAVKRPYFVEAANRAASARE